MPQIQSQQSILGSDSSITPDIQGCGPADPDTEFIEGAYAEDELQSLDFDNSSASNAMQEREPGSDFDTLDDDTTSMFDIATATDSIDDIDVLSDIDLAIEDPF